MFSHVMLGAKDFDESKKFYDATFGALGFKEGFIDPKGRCFWSKDGVFFAITKPIDGNPATAGNGSTIGFTVSSPEQGDAWHRAGLENGGTAIENPPGIRESESGRVYLAYLRDPAGNKLCALRMMD
jgi:catechol 2,3-dioxygenase-like lactoylglutathione lyase family enzyme